MKKLQPLIILLFISNCLMGSNLSGYVFDNESKEPLPGATIVIEGTSIGVTTDYDGYYIIPLLKQGTHTILVSFIGYTEVSEQITIEKNKDIEKSFYLAYGSEAIEEITITVQAKGQVKAINQQLGADAIINVISSERIQEVPDANIAESISRLPGVSVIRSDGEGDQITVRGLEPKYNLVTINGVRSPSAGANNNAVGLAGISPFMIGSVELQKSLTPDKDADVVGAIINLTLKEASEGWHGNLIFENNYNTLAATAFNPKLTLQGSNRFFNNKLGIILQGNYEDIDRTNNRMNATYELDGEGKQRLTSGDFSHNSLNRQRYGASILMDYKLSNGKLKFSSFVNGYADDALDRKRVIQPIAGIFKNNNFISGKKNISYVNSLNFEHKLFLNSTVDVGLSYTSAKSEKEEYIISQRWHNLSANADIRDQSAYVLSEFDEQALEGRDSLTYIYTMGAVEEQFTENELAAQINWKVPFVVSNSISGFFKVGGKYRVNNRNNNNDGTSFVMTDGDGQSVRDAVFSQNPELYVEGSGAVGANIPTINVIDHSFSQDILDGQFHLKSFMQEEKVNQIMDRMVASNWANSHLAYFDLPMLRNDYEGQSKFKAAYFMMNLNLSKYLNVVGGVRYEDEKTDFQSWGIKLDGERSTHTEHLRDSLRQNSFLLPMINLKFKPFDWVDLRLAYTQSLARPSYYKFMPRYFRDTDGDLNNMGNPNIEPAIAHNYDAYLSFHSNKLGLLSLGVFYKNLKGFEYTHTFQVVDESVNDVHPYNVVVGDGNKIKMPLNNPNDGMVKGIEIDWQTVFWYLPKPFNGLVFNINYSKMFSETKFQTVVITKTPGEFPWTPIVTAKDSSYVRPLLHQPNDVFNASLGYDFRGFSARVAYNFKGRTLQDVTGLSTKKDDYSQFYSQWDFAIRQKLPWAGMQVSLNITNLSNSFVQDFKTASSDLPIKEEYYGTMFILGLRMTL